MKPINYLELRAVTNNIRAFAQHIRSGDHIRLWEDNLAVVHIINSMTSRSREMMAELRIIHKLLTKLGATIKSDYLPSAVNAFADRLSRLRTLDDWTIDQKAIRSILNAQPPTIDRFADDHNKIVDRFNSAYECPGSSGTDALTLPWAGESNYWNPPLRLIPLVVRKIKEEKAKGILVTPHWPNQTWYASLRDYGEPTLFEAPEVFRPPLWAPPWVKPPPWKIAIWTINI